MGRKYSSEYMIQYIKNEGYVFLDNNIYLTNCVQRIVVKDSGGYLYDTTFNCIQTNAERNQRAKSVYIYNRFSFQNIITWAINNNKSYSVVGGEYLGHKNRTIVLSCDICSKEWVNSWQYLLDGAGCLHCSNKILSRDDSLGVKYPWLIDEWDYEKNKRSPFSYSTRSSESVYWKCPICKKNWTASIQGRTRYGNLCRHVEKIRKEKKKIPQRLISELSQTRNTKDLLDDFPRTTKKYWWKCYSCGYEWNCRLGDRVSKGSGCPLCAGSILIKEKSFGALFPDLLKEWNYEKNGNPYEYFPFTRKRVWWNCSVCENMWDTMLGSRTGSRKSGCPYCSGYNFTEENSLFALMPELMKEWDFERNTDDPKNFSLGSKDKQWWKCSICGNGWKTSISVRTQGCGCPKCSSSKGEKRVGDFLSNANIRFTRQKTFDDCRNKRKLPFDFYLLDYNTIIEYDGEFHFDLPKFRFKNKERRMLELLETQKHDAIKTKYCEDNEIKLLRIPYWDFDNIETIVSNYLCL